MSTVPGNTSTTEVLSVGETEIRTLTTAGDADWFKVTLTAGLTYGFKASSAGGPGIGLNDPDLGLYDTLGNELVHQTVASSSVNSFSYRALASGTYFVGVHDTGTDIGQFALNWVATDTIRNDTGTTSSLIANGTVKSKIDVAHDEDWFGFNMTAGLSYGLEVKADGVGGLPDADVFIYDSLGNVVDHKLNMSSTLNLLAHAATTTGHYFLGVGDNGGSDFGGYAARFIATDTIQNNISTTNSLARNTATISKIDVANDADWFKVSLTAGLSYAFEVKSYGAGGLPDGDVKLMDAAGNVVATAYNGVYSINTLAFTAGASGNYFVSVSDNGNYDTGAYQLRNVGLDSVVANQGTSRLLLDGRYLTGLIDAAGDKDWHKFNAEQGVTYTFKLTGDGTAAELASCRLTLRDALGNAVSVVSGETAVVTYTATADGPLFLDVQGSSLSYAGKFVLSVVSTAATLTGTTANDHINGGSGNTVISLNLGNDWADGGLGNDHLFGAAGNDSLFGNAGADILYGGANNDYLSGGSDADKLDGGSGNDTLTGGAGSDQFIFTTASNADTVLDFQDGADKIRIIGGPSSISGLAFAQLGENVRVSFGATSILILNEHRLELTAADFLFA